DVSPGGGKGEGAGQRGVGKRFGLVEGVASLHWRIIELDQLDVAAIHHVKGEAQRFASGVEGGRAASTYAHRNRSGQGIIEKNSAVIVGIIHAGCDIVCGVGSKVSCRGQRILNRVNSGHTEGERTSQGRVG